MRVNESETERGRDRDRVNESKCELREDGRDWEEFPHSQNTKETQKCPKWSIQWRWQSNTIFWAYRQILVLNHGNDDKESPSNSDRNKTIKEKKWISLFSNTQTLNTHTKH
jgi:hypothetical protein